MGLTTKRLGSAPDEPHTLEVREALPFASALLWHLTHLRGLKVIAKKSWALTDDFEAYFTYKERLFVVETPFANVNVVLLGPAADERLFSEVEAQVQSFPWYLLLLGPVVLYDVIEISPADLATVDIWINHHSHLVSRAVFADGRFRSDGSDYRRVGDVMVPFTQVSEGVTVKSETVSFEAAGAVSFSLPSGHRP